MKVTRAPNNLLNRFVDKNIVAGTPGTQIIAEDLNMIFDELLAPIDALGLTQSYTDNTLLKKAIGLQSALGLIYLDTGTANSYVLNKPANSISPVELRAGTIIIFSPVNTNTGISTINYCGLSGFTSIAIKRIDGADVQAGDITAGHYITLAYNGSVFVKISSPVIENNTLYNNNLFDNGEMQIYQRQKTYTLVNGVYGFAVDRWAGMTEGTTVSAGTLEQKTTSTLSASGYSVIFKNVTVTGIGISHLRQRICAQDANTIKNKIIANGIDVLHDVGSNINYTIYLRKANAVNDFTATTDIANSGAISVASGTATRIKFQNQNLGDCSNGLEIEYRIAHGAITSKNFEFSNAKLEIGSFCTDFRTRTFTDELIRCKRYYEKSYTYGTAPATAISESCVVFAYIELNNPVGTYRYVCSYTYGSPKVKLPSLKFYSPQTGAIDRVTHYNGTTDYVVSSYGNASTDRLCSHIETFSGTLLAVKAHWVSNAEL